MLVHVFFSRQDHGHVMTGISQRTGAKKMMYGRACQYLKRDFKSGHKRFSELFYNSVTGNAFEQQ